MSIFKTGRVSREESLEVRNHAIGSPEEPSKACGARGASEEIATNDTNEEHSQVVSAKKTPANSRLFQKPGEFFSAKASAEMLPRDAAKGHKAFHNQYF